MTRPLALGLVLLATAASAADLATATRHLEPSRVAPSRKVQWAPSGNFQALHARSVFRSETGSGARPYGRARGETAAGFGIFLSRDSYEGNLNLAPSLHRFAYGRFNPLRYSDPTGHCFGSDYSCYQAFIDLYKASSPANVALEVASLFTPDQARGADERLQIGAVPTERVASAVYAPKSAAGQATRNMDAVVGGSDRGEQLSLDLQSVKDDIDRRAPDLTSGFDECVALAVEAIAKFVPGYSASEDTWHAPTAAVWHAAWVTSLHFFLVELGQPIPAIVRDQMAWFARGRWPSAYTQQTVSAPSKEYMVL